MHYCLFLFAHLFFESLPVSSSGHLTLLEKLTGRFARADFALSQTFNFLLHGPTSVILALFFRKRWLPVLYNMRRCRRLIFKLILLGICAEVPTLIFYFFFSASRHDGRGSFLNTSFPLWLGFGLTALLLYSLRLCRARQTTSVTPSDAFVIGCVQGLALLPGISRMGSTYVVGRWLGLTPRLSFYFSCTIEWPLITLAFLRGVADVFCGGAGGFREVVSGFCCIFPAGSDLATLLCAGFCLVAASVLSYYVLKFTQSLMIQNKVWRLSFYMLIPITLALIL